jgi:hypothetical protein
MEKNEGNKLIDAFMGEDGFIGKEYEEHYSDEFWRPTKHEFKSEDLEYHSSWDWLMPVVIKCRKLYNESDSEDTTIALMWDVRIGDEIEKVYYHTIQFIQWFNKQNSREG